MFKRSIVTCAFMLLAVASAVLPASAVNDHNGYIRVKNNAANPVSVSIWTWSSTKIMQTITVAPNGWADFNACCYAAGTRYDIRFSTRVGMEDAIGFKDGIFPRLCNNGVPFGYAHVTITSGMGSTGKPWVEARQDDSGCN